MQERQLFRYTSIDQFRQVNYDVKRRAEYIGAGFNNEPAFDPTRPKPTLLFTGKIKMHGMNVGVVVTDEADVYAQTREMVLGNGVELNGVDAYVTQRSQYFYNLLYPELAPGVIAVVAYGEWIGTGTIKKGQTAISGLEPCFVVFDVCRVLEEMESDGNGGMVHKREWLTDLSAFNEPEMRLFNSDMFQTYEVTIDFNDPAPALAHIEQILDEVVQQCPVGQYFGLEGYGEGLVWRNVDNPNERYLFKVAGNKHKRTKTQEPIPMDPEVLKSIEDFVAITVTEQRLEQGIVKLGELGLALEPRSLGVFLKWVYDDIVSEEADTLKVSGIDPKSTGKFVQAIAKPWYMNYLNAS